MMYGPALRFQSRFQYAPFIPTRVEQDFCVIEYMARFGMDADETTSIIPLFLASPPSPLRSDLPLRVGSGCRYPGSWLWWRVPRALARAWDARRCPAAGWRRCA